MTDCQRGCLLTNQHIPDCTCTHECPEHGGHCDGCLPKRADIGGYCTRCANKLRDTLNGIPELVLSAALMPGGRLATRQVEGDTWRRATKVDQMSPSPACDTADEANWWAHSWATMLADDLGETGPFRYRTDGVPQPNVSVSVRYITDRFEQVLSADYANDLFDEAHQIRTQLVRATGSDNADQRIPTPCPLCGFRTLVRPNGEGNVTCRNRHCEGHWMESTYGQLAKVVNQ